MDEVQARLILAWMIRLSPFFAAARKWTASMEAVTQTFALWRSATTRAIRSSKAVMVPPKAVP